MKSFCCRLIAPRASFLSDMSADEQHLMREHGTYWREAMATGKVVAFGLVADPAGAFGIGLVEFEDEADARTFTDNDPTIRSDRGFRFEIQPMPFGVVWPGRA